MWNSPKKIQIHPIVWEGKEQGLDIYISRCETPIDLFLLFWLACTYSKNYVTTNIYATKVVEGKNTKGGANWTKLIVLGLKVFIKIIIFMVVKKVSQIKLQ